MTFDEAVREVQLISMNGLDDMSGEDAIRLINMLREEYAPTVEMTKKKYHSFKLWKYHTAGWNMTNCAEWSRDEDITANNAMRAWLHPETIKIIGDENE